MSGTSLDGATPSVAPSESAAPLPAGNAGDPRGSAPAPVDTTEHAQAKPEGPDPDKQSRREARAFASQRREIRELHRQLGYMQAQMESFRSPAPQAEGEGSPQPRQTQSPADSAAARREAAAARQVLDRLEEAGDEIEGFDKVMRTITGDFPMTTVMRDFLGETEKPAEMAKWLSENPEEAMRISLLSDAVAVRALERAEGRLSAAKAAPVKTTKAPPPVPTVGGRSTPEFDPDKASMEEYAAHWKERQAKR